MSWCRAREQLTGVCIILLILTSLAACSSGDAEESEVDDSVAIAAHEVTTRELSRSLSLSALVAAREHVRVHARISGNLQDLSIEEGDGVAAGDLLASLDMAEQRAELTRARAMEEQAQLTYDRTRELYQRNSLSSAEYQQARADLQVASSETELRQARVGFGEITTPISGQVTGRYVEPGEHVQEQDMLFSIADMTTLVVRFGVSELDVRYLKPGDSVPLQVDALPGETLEGEIRRIYPSAESDSRRVPVEITLPEDAFERGVRPGYLVRLAMPIDRREDILAIPTLAVGTEGTGDAGPFVYRVRDDQLERQEVTPGIVRGQWTEITEGLEKGDTILATNPRDRRDGEAVRIVEWRE
ncbi:MAG: efflux RND transporter periplasmic adaptor subunit [Halomonadaceae bacterium]|nr:MAG: efflux RND transporter periplasmic adaptor subunit [Halomonadaceae bacterium]